MKTKTFDCVQMMHEGAAAVRRELRGKSLSERLEYWSRHTKAMKQRQRVLRTKAERQQ